MISKSSIFICIYIYIRLSLHLLILRIIHRDDTSWSEKFMEGEGGICALQLALLWFPTITCNLSLEVVRSHSIRKSTKLTMLIVAGHSSTLQCLEFAFQNKAPRHKTGAGQIQTYMITSRRLRGYCIMIVLCFGAKTFS